MNPIDRAIILDEAKRYSDRKGGYIITEVIASGKLTDGVFSGTSTKLLEIGKTYTLHLDSGVYTTVAKYSESLVTNYIGNLSILGGEDTGESFLAYVADVDGENVFLLKDTNSGKSFNLKTETVHPIDPKFIPGDYIVDLDALGFTSDAVHEGVELPAEVGNALKKTASSCGGIVVKLGRSVCRLPNFFSAEGLNEYIWGGGFFTGEIIWISAYFEPEDNYFVLVDTPLMSAASEEKLDV